MSTWRVTSDLMTNMQIHGRKLRKSIILQLFFNRFVSWVTLQFLLPARILQSPKVTQFTGHSGITHKQSWNLSIFHHHCNKTPTLNMYDWSMIQQWSITSSTTSQVHHPTKHYMDATNPRLPTSFCFPSPGISLSPRSANNVTSQRGLFWNGATSLRPRRCGCGERERFSEGWREWASKDVKEGRFRKKTCNVVNPIINHPQVYHK